MQKIKKNLFTIHSQKGGVGKTSIAIALAGLTTYSNENSKTVIIDADMTGTSIADLFSVETQTEFIFLGNDRNTTTDNKFYSGKSLEPKSKKASRKFLNDLLFASPAQFIANTRKGQINKYLNKYDNNIYYMPSSPQLKDIFKIVPLIAQEDKLHFFKHRFMKIIDILFKDYDNIVIDCPPGLFGLSKTIIDLILEYRKKNVNNGERDTTFKSFLVTTPDRVDFLSLIPSFLFLLNEMNFKKTDKVEHILEHFVLTVNKGNEINTVKAFNNIFNVLDKLIEEDSDSDNTRKYFDLLRKQSETENLYMPHCHDFAMEKILSDCKNHANDKFERKPFFTHLSDFINGGI